jgi:hypothetical protein
MHDNEALNELAAEYVLGWKWLVDTRTGLRFLSNVDRLDAVPSLDKSEPKVPYNASVGPAIPRFADSLDAAARLEAVIAAKSKDGSHLDIMYAQKLKTFVIESKGGMMNDFALLAAPARERTRAAILTMAQARMNELQKKLPEARERDARERVARRLEELKKRKHEEEKIESARQLKAEANAILCHPPTAKKPERVRGILI